jgi:spermidine synthase
MAGCVDFVPDGQGGIVVLLDGHPQSHVVPNDPGLLTFEYVQHLAAAIDALRDGPLTVTHVGGAGLTLARYINHTRPGSPQVVLEPDAKLTERVRRELPLPRRHRIRVRPVDGRRGLPALAAGSADVVVVDAYAGGRVPAELTSLEWFDEVARVLRADGVALMNTADEPSRRHLARLHAGLRTPLPHTAAIATTEIWKGRRFGNTVLVASAGQLPLEALTRNVARGAFPSSVRHGAALARLLGDARPFTDVDARSTPAPPPADGWRLR